MTSESAYTPREYQTKILDRVDELQGTNLLLELDCGMGKRFITHQIVVDRFPDLRFIIVANSTSSLQETVDYFREEYGGLEGELGELSSRVQGSRRRRQAVKDSRVLVCTPLVLQNQLRRDGRSVLAYDSLIINEVDKIVRRVGDERVLTRPWTMLLSLFRSKWIIGMSGTMRDEHAVVLSGSVQMHSELETLRRFIPNTEVLSMEDLSDTDLPEHISPTRLTIEGVDDGTIRHIASSVDDLIRDSRPRGRHQGDVRELHLSGKQGKAYNWLLLFRKMLYGMPPWSFKRKLFVPYLRRKFDAFAMQDPLTRRSQKSERVREIALAHEKTVVLSSYLDAVREVEEVMDEVGVQTYVVTGEVMNKGEVLREFKEHAGRAVLALSPVGERDLDIPQAEVMVICDATNTAKTMYQRLKRTRGGKVIFLVYTGTSEVDKVRRLIGEIEQKYPWSVDVG